MVLPPSLAAGWCCRCSSAKLVVSRTFSCNTKIIILPWTVQTGRTRAAVQWVLCSGRGSAVTYFSTHLFWFDPFDLVAETIIGAKEKCDRWNYLLLLLFPAPMLPIPSVSVVMPKCLPSGSLCVPSCIIRCHVLPHYLTGSLFPLFIILYLFLLCSKQLDFLMSTQGKKKILLANCSYQWLMPTLSILFRSLLVVV